YARSAFGRLLGIETGWLLWLAQLAAPAANANLFVIYLGEFWPQVRQPAIRIAVLSLLIGLLTLVNYRGVRGGARISRVFTAAKLVPLLIVVLAGAAYVLTPHSAAPLPIVEHPDRLKAVLLLVFAYGGFETALTPMGEARNPRRDVAFALFAAFLACT